MPSKYKIMCYSPTLIGIFTITPYYLDYVVLLCHIYNMLLALLCSSSL